MLEIKNLSAGYGGSEVLSDVSLKIEKGALTSLIGINGCGKSTLLKTALGLIKPYRGTVTLDGTSVPEEKRRETAKRIAYLSQGKTVPDMTVAHLVLQGRFPYLKYPRSYTKEDVEISERAMKKLDITHLAKKELSSLSGGMRQCAYIAMALAQETDYILLDEPMTYLDVSHQLELMRILRALASEGKGIVTVMHDLPMAFDFSDRIAVLDRGSIVMDGKPSEIYGDGRIEEIFGVRLKYLAAEEKYIYLIK